MNANDDESVALKISSKSIKDRLTRTDDCGNTSVVEMSYLGGWSNVTSGIARPLPTTAGHGCATED